MEKKVLETIEECLLTAEAPYAGAHYHIDEILGKKLNREDWVPVGLETLREAIEHRRGLKLRVDIVLAFNLRSLEDRPIGLNFTNMQELQREFEAECPPCLMAFPPGEYNALRAIDIASVAESCGLIREHDVLSAYYFEYAYPDPCPTDYNRLLHIVSFDTSQLQM